MSGKYVFIGTDPLALAASSGASLVGYAPDNSYPSGTVGARLNETLTSTGFSTLQAAVTAAAGKTLHVLGTWTLTSAVTVQANTSIYLDASALVQTATAGISLFKATSVDNVHVYGFGKFKQTASNSSAYVAAVHFDTCTNSSVTGSLEFEGMQWSGVYIESGSKIKVIGGRFHDWLGTVDDSAAVTIYKNASDCTVEGIYVDATGHFGVHCQDPGGVGTYKPQRNKIRHNRIFNTKAYGITNYIGGATDTYNLIEGNHVEGVTGAVGNSTGTGIYCVGTGGGGLRIINNTVVNCVISTTDATNIHGGISLSDIAATNAPVVIEGNVINGMTQANGIVINGCDGVVLGANCVLMPSSNDGSHAGGATFRGNALKIINSSNVSVNGGRYIQNGVIDAVLVQSSSGNLVGISINLGVVTSAAGCPFRTTRTGTDTISGSIAGGVFSTTSNSPNAFQLEGFSGTVAGVVASCGSQAALAVTGCLGLRVVNSKFTTTGTTGLSATGTCTGSFYDKSNSHNGNVSNLSTGMAFEYFATATPATGSAAVGDHWVHSTPAASTKPGEYCTTAGSPGTWKAEAALAA